MLMQTHSLNPCARCGPRRAQVAPAKIASCAGLLRAARVVAPRLPHPPSAASVSADPGSAAAADPAAPERAAPAAPAAEGARGAEPFSWTKQWWPVHVVDLMDRSKPHPITLLGQSYVAWWDAPGGQWRLFQDRCPHRLAPLSEGRIEADGTLACSYHGWRFDGGGACTKIPQIGDPKAHAVATASPRACAKSYPTQVKGGVLFAWLDDGPNAAAAAAQKQIPMPKVIEEDPSSFMFSEVPIDFPMWLEQGFDPSHGPFLHDGIAGMRQGDSRPMDGDPLPPSKIDLAKGFTWHHGAYMGKYEGMKGERIFEAPSVFHTEYDKGPIGLASIYATPSRPGVTRLMAKFTFKKAPGLFSLLAKLPHWLFLNFKLQDQDTIMNAKQANYMRQNGLTHHDYYSPSRADVGVTAARSWFDRVGYEDMWKARMAPAALEAARALPEATTEQLLNLWDRHTKHCKICQEGMAQMEKAASLSRAASVLLGVLAAALAAAARAPSPAALAAGAGALAALWLAGALERARYEKFINSAGAWRRDGGLSRVKGAGSGPIVL